jgi:hypothetical protein
MKAVVFEMKEEGPIINDVSVPGPAKEQVLVNVTMPPSTIWIYGFGRGKPWIRK